LKLDSVAEHQKYAVKNKPFFRRIKKCPAEAEVLYLYKTTGSAGRFVDDVNTYTLSYEH
jgi:hypothetical protein